MKQEKTSTITSLNTKLNDFLTKHHQKTFELNNKIVQIQTEIKEKSSALLNSLASQQVDLVYHIYQTELDLRTKLNDLKDKQLISELKSNEFKNKPNSNQKLNQVESLKQIAELRGFNFKTEFIASTNGNSLKIGEIIRKTEQVNISAESLI